MSGHEPEKQQELLQYLRQELPALRQGPALAKVNFLAK